MPLLATFTVRCGADVQPGKALLGRCNGTMDGRGLGLRAVLSWDDGVTWDFERDRFIISDKTGTDQWSGGGYGNTIQLADGALISVHSWRARVDEQGNQQTHVEAVRWALPDFSRPLKSRE